MLDDPNGYINLLDDCPVCRGVLEPHCNVSACDIVRCQRCLNIGSIDGRYWPKTPTSDGAGMSSFFASLLGLDDERELP